MTIREPRDERRGRRVRFAIIGLLAVGAIAWSGLRPDSSASDAMVTAPTWKLEIASAGGGSPLVLVFGREAGVHLMRVPGTRSPSAKLEMGLIDREVWMISLGRNRLAVRGDAGGAGGMRSFTASGRVVTAFQEHHSIGVRAGF